MRKRLIRVAQGLEPADLVIQNARVLNVFTGEILPQDVAVADGCIAGVGRYAQADRVEDAGGLFLVPGLINAHCHVESSMVTPARYAAEELRWGVTTLITDPHEIANVAGAQGIRYMLEASEGLPVRYYVMAPSCVPATSFEHAGATLEAGDLAPFLDHPRVLGLGEMMNGPGLLACDPMVLDKLSLFAGRPLDGHAPGMTGPALAAYAAAGIETDHESTTLEEAMEKLRSGLAVLVRQGSACRNLEDLLPGLIQSGADRGRIAFCTDDKHIADIRREGTVRVHIRRAIELGLPVADAYRMGSWNAARLYGLEGLGAVAPGYGADFVLLRDLAQVDVARVYQAGCQVWPAPEPEEPPAMPLPPPSVHIRPLQREAFALPPPLAQGHPAIRLVDGQILTQREWIAPETVEKRLGEGSLLKLSVIERHHASGSMGVGLLSRYGLRRGAVATTVAHDSHNLIVAGTADGDMHLAVDTLRECGGGYVLVEGGRVLGCLPLPIYGLISDAPAAEVARALSALVELARQQGVNPAIDPFLTLSFLALPVIPSLRLTDMGLFDVDAGQWLGVQAHPHKYGKN